MIEIKGLTKKYGNHTAVDNINFTVEKGEVLGFLGPNGAGKSTTMNIITGYIPSTEGTVTVAGYDILEQPDEAKRRIGYLPEQPPLYFDMTVSEYLAFVYDLKKVKQNRKSHIDEIMDLVKIGDVQNRLIKNLSKGYKQRVGLAQALLGNPEVLILDEPTVGLDPKQIIEIRNVITDLRKEHTIILSSHILPEVSAICERVIIINKGKIAAIDTPDNLSKVLTNESKLMVRIAGDDTKVLECIKELEGIKYVEIQGQKEPDTFDYIVEAEPNMDIRKPLFFTLSKNQYPILMLKSLDLSLEDIFLQLTTTEEE
ncbi:ATP-binding cassette domain-containing protein [Petroclostridium sp. X23]|uniref:ABC transporter ATP-binding protein n=1 Tax=Petroclostridium sp. X23 TaxID=3045146 RepID=UPI0024AD94A3|nr:ATP-binding cassette domain-containing protein [Petroclostridium sp. X23]WHH60240.1 ATP-binding cassette domain-containing protein [Petroclostridium sp. X23]